MNTACTVHRVDQRSDEWRQLRVGRLTGSRVGDALAKVKGGYAASRKNLLTQLVLERLTGQVQESGYTNAAMERGVQLEPVARRAYEAETGILSESVGFVTHRDLLVGCSPDGLTEDGLIEIKCPLAAAHLDYLKGGLPEKYRLQLVHGLWLTGAAWGDFVSFHPDFPAGLQLKITRLQSADVDFPAHERAVREFLNEVDAELAVLRTMVDLPGQLKASVEAA